MAILKGKNPKHNWTIRQPPQRPKRGTGLEHSAFLLPAASMTRFTITFVHETQPRCTLLRQMGEKKEKQPLPPRVHDIVGIDQSIPCVSLLSHTCGCAPACFLACRLTRTALRGKSDPLGGQGSGHRCHPRRCHCRRPRLGMVCRPKVLKLAPFDPSEWGQELQGVSFSGKAE